MMSFKGFDTSMDWSGCLKQCRQCAVVSVACVLNLKDIWNAFDGSYAYMLCVPTGILIMC